MALYHRIITPFRRLRGASAIVAVRWSVRGDDGIIKEISDGIVFPILSALSRFVKKAKTRAHPRPRWNIIYPRVTEMAERYSEQATAT
jgi:hypothetical protein